MKAVIICGDGMSDHAVAKLGGKTPLMVARKPHLDLVARQGRMGLFQTIPPGLPNGSEVANLSILGYAPEKYYRGRAVLEAANMGVDLSADDVALRCNLICLSEEKIKNHSAGHITSEEAGELIRELDRALGQRKGEQPVSFHLGVSYRHLLVLHGGWASDQLDCAPPHDHVGGSAEALLPKPRNKAAGPTALRLTALYRQARHLLQDHPLNRARQIAGKDPANSIWPWSPGHRPTMQTLQQRFGIAGAMISAVDLLMGLGRYAGMEVIRVPGATGLHDTNYEGKAEAALQALTRYDLVYVHVEATDEAAHARDLELKIRCIEYLDQRLVRPVLQGIENRGLTATVAILPDHPTPVESGAHASDPVPVAILQPGQAPDQTQSFDEEQARQGSLGLLRGEQFIRQVIGK